MEKHDGTGRNRDIEGETYEIRVTLEGVARGGHGWLPVAAVMAHSFDVYRRAFPLQIYMETIKKKR